MVDSSQQAQPQNSASQIYLRLIKYLKPYSAIFGLSIIGFLLYAYSNAQFIYILKNLLQLIEHKDSQSHWLIPLEVIGFTLLRGLGSFVGTYCLAKVSYGIIHRLRTDVFNHMTHLPISLFDARNSNHLISVIIYNINGVTEAVTDAARVFLREGSQVIWYFALLLIMDWQLTMVFLFIAPFIGLLVSAVAKRLRRLTDKVQNSVGDITQVTSEMINGVRVMRSFGGESYEKKRFEAASFRNYLQNMKIVLTAAANTPLIQLLVSFAIALLIFVVLGYSQMRDPVEFVAYMVTVGAILQPMRRLGEVGPMILKGVSAADSIFQLIDEPTETDTGSTRVERTKGNVTFENVTFSYANQNVKALNSISLSVKAGEVIALVGQSGSGKSTLVNLLPRFYEPTQGTIKIDSIPLQDFELKNLREQIAYVNQQVTLFDGTVAENIAYGQMDRYSVDEIKRAAKMAYALDFIESDPLGFDAPIGEGGTRLSGGQRQRLAIARAILKNAPILIMDEATSALDNESERYIQAALEQVMKGRTTFVIAHRLTTIERADRILVMDKGCIVEQGTHLELLALKGYYARLHSNQFKDLDA